MKRINVYMSDSEYNDLSERARKTQRSMSNLVRDAISRPPLVIELGQDLTPDQVIRIRSILKERPPRDL